VYQFDFTALRVRRNIDPDDGIDGKHLRNQGNFDFVRHATGCRDPTPGNVQTAMAPWVAQALRKAYPWHSDPAFPDHMTIEIEDAIIAARSARAGTADEVVEWCTTIDAGE